MIALVALAVIAAFFWTAVIRWARHLDAALALDAYRPSAADVADLENSLPHIPGDPHFVIAEDVQAYVNAVADWKAGRTYDEADQ